MSKKELIRENIALKQMISVLKEEIGQLKKMIFGAKRERFEAAQNPMQGLLFEGLSTATQVAEQETEVLTKPVHPKKRKSNRKGIKRNRFPVSLERKTTTILPLDVDTTSLT